MKTVLNTSAHKVINIEYEGEVITIKPQEMRTVSNETARVIQEGWKEAQVTEVSVEAPEPWELKVLPSLPPEMRAKVKITVPKVLKPAATPEIAEPQIPVDELENQRLGKPANNHVCPRGCGFSSPYLKVTRKHMAKCSPIPSQE